MKKILLLLIVAILLPAAAFSGGQPGETDSGKTEIRFSWWGGEERHEGTLKMIEAFEATYPEIDVVPEYSGWDGYQEKVMTQLASGTAPAVMQLDHPWLAELKSRLLDMSNLDVNAADFSADIIEGLTLDGELKGLPTGKNTEMYFYVKEVYEAAGIDYPRTWDELFKAAEVFQTTDWSKTRFADLGQMYPLHGYAASTMFKIWLEQKYQKTFLDADREITLSEEEIASGFEFVQSLFDAGVMPDKKAQSGDTESAAFYQGAFAGILEDVSYVGSDVDKFAQGGLTMEVGPFIVIDDAARMSDMTSLEMKFSQLLSLSIELSESETAAAAGFVKHMLTDPEAAMILGTIRGLPSSNTSLETLLNAGNVDPIVASAFEEIARNNTRSVDPVFRHWGITDQIDYANEAISAEEMTPKAATGALMRAIWNTIWG